MKSDHSLKQVKASSLWRSTDDLTTQAVASTSLTFVVHRLFLTRQDASLIALDLTGVLSLSLSLVEEEDFVNP